MPENPLIQALGQGPPPIGEGPDRIVIEHTRILRTNVRELENGMRLMPGTAVNFKGSGTIKMIDEDGDILLNVTRIDGKAGNDEQSESQDGTIIKPVESPSPS